MSITLQCVSASRGIAIGRAHIIQSDQIDIQQYRLKSGQVDDEIMRFNNAIADARGQLRAIRDQIPISTSIDIAAFIDTHLLMLEDVALTEEPRRIIKAQLCNAEWALTLQRDALVNVFNEMDDPYLSTRRDDVNHVVNRILLVLLKQKPLLHGTPKHHLKDQIIITEDLTPIDTVLMQHQGIAGFATEFGGITSHTAIIARSFGIPAMIGLHHTKRFIKNDDLLIVDGDTGIIIIDPDKTIKAYYEKQQRKQKRYYSSLHKITGTPTKTINGIAVNLLANVDLPKDFATAKALGVKGVGLYRTEFLYMDRETLPDEEEHYQTYVAALDTLNGLYLTIRTLDLGADKQIESNSRQLGKARSNPALGLRAIRLCLKEIDLFKTQLRAILRASAHGPIRIMIPMLSNIQETQQVFQVIDDIKMELQQQAIAYDQYLQIGGMIEVPAAAICADIFAKKLDFLSIGTNDLIQYTMATDRINDEVNYLYEPLHPAMLRLIQNVILAGKVANIPVAMCGEMAGDKRYTRLLLGLGLREFSVNIATLLEIKQIINNTDLRQFTKLIKQVLEAESGVEIDAILKEKFIDPL